MNTEMTNFINYINENCKCEFMDHYKLNTRGRKYLKTSNGKPQFVPDNIIQNIQNLKQDDGSYRLDQNYLKPGDKRRAKQALARKRARKKIRRDVD